MRHLNEYKRGLRMGIPIGLGYFAVSISLGMLAKKSGLSIVEAVLSSLLLNASAGEYALFSIIATGGGYLQVGLTVLIANARYFLMSCALGQRLSDRVGTGGRLAIGFGITDEMFGVSIGQTHKVELPFYLGMMSVAVPMWSLGTGLGALLGSILPSLLVNAFSVSLYGMFLASIVPQAKASKVMLAAVVTSFLASLLFSVLPIVSSWDSGTRTILLTVGISALFALLFPKKEEDLAHE